MHVDVANNNLSIVLISLLELIGFSQRVHKPTHCFIHTLNLVLAYLALYQG